MRKIQLVMAACIAAFSVSCNNFKVIETPEGDRILMHEKGDGVDKAKEGDLLTFDLVIKSSTDSVFKDTYKEGKPFMVPLQKETFKGSFENGLKNLVVGDSATIFVSADSLFTKMAQPLPPGVNAGTDLSFICKIRKIQSKDEFKKELEDKQANESKTIDDYVSTKLAGAKTSEDGIRYLITKEGTGKSPIKGDTVQVNYSGKFFDGKEFDASKGEPLSFPLGMGYVIPGWDATLQTMKIGEKRTVVIPSELGYGKNGAGGVIEPYTPLVFEMELVNIK